MRMRDRFALGAPVVVRSVSGVVVIGRVHGGDDDGTIVLIDWRIPAGLDVPAPVPADGYVNVLCVKADLVYQVDEETYIRQVEGE